MNEVIYVCLLL